MLYVNKLSTSEYCVKYKVSKRKRTLDISPKAPLDVSPQALRAGEIVSSLNSSFPNHLSTTKNTQCNIITAGIIHMTDILGNKLIINYYVNPFCPSYAYKSVSAHQIYETKTNILMKSMRSLFQNSE